MTVKFQTPGAGVAEVITEITSPASATMGVKTDNSCMAVPLISTPQRQEGSCLVIWLIIVMEMQMYNLTLR